MSLTIQQQQDLTALVQKLLSIAGYRPETIGDLGGLIGGVATAGSNTGATAGVNQSIVTAKLFTYTAPATASTTGITAAFSGNDVPIDPTNEGVAIVQPTTPRNVTVTFGATWDALNNVTIYGTDQFDTVVSELFAGTGAGTTVTGNQIFKTITKVTKVEKFDDGAGNAANTASVGTGVKLGVVGHLANTFGDGHLIGTGFDAPTLDATWNSVQFATAPNGARTWNLNVNVTQTVVQNTHVHTQG